MRHNYISFWFRMLVLLFGGIVQLPAQELVQKTNLPTIYIDTEGGQEITSKEDYILSTLYYVDESGTTQYDKVQIRGRGNSTWGLAKKPYRLKFNEKVKFLGSDHANAKSWTLLANYADKTLMRNAVASCIGDFARQPFTASAQFVDLVLNGVFLGNYQVSDQMEIRKKRVDITEQDEVMTEGANITGGYFLEVDGFATAEPVYYRTDRGVLVTIKSPDEDIIAQAQVDYIRNHMQKFEDALFAEDFTHPETGYRQYVDSMTLASWYIATELTGNVDGFWSTYMYKEKDDPKFYWGPLWDYDIAFNNCDRVGDVSRELMINQGFGSELTKIWILRMWQDPWFVSLINRTWKECVERGFEEHVISCVDSIATLLEESQRLNFAKWPIDQHVYNELVLFSTYREGVDYLKSFLHTHFEYLTEVFAQAESGEGNAPMPTPVFASDTRHYYRIYNKGNGNVMDTTGDGKACMWENVEGKQSQQWDIVPSGDYFRIVNRASGMSLSDDAEWRNDGYQTGSQLALSESNDADYRQLWSVVPVNSGNSYVVVNRATNLAWNNNGGFSENGNPIISWTNDENNAQKDTRQWHLVKDELKNELTDAICDLPREVQYVVSYNPETRQLRFASEDMSLLKGQAAIYDLSGVCYMQFPIQELVDVSGLPSKVYVLCWTESGVTRSVKFMKE